MRPLATARYERIDALRGIAIVWMTCFHLAFDLAYFGWTKQNFYADPFWTWQRTAIVSLFLFCAGLGQAVANVQAQTWRRLWRRWAQVAGCAVLVTAGSYLMFPRSFIYFGVLHGIAVMLIIMRLTAGWGRWLWLAGAAALALKFVAAWAHAAGLAPPILDTPALNWLGLIGRKPITEDYVPLVPWLGVMWWGMAAGQLLLRRTTLMTGALPRSGVWLAWLGQRSLSWYMLHQPVLIAIVAAATAASK